MTTKRALLIPCAASLLAACTPSSTEVHGNMPGVGGPWSAFYNKEKFTSVVITNAPDLCGSYSQALTPMLPDGGVAAILGFSVTERSIGITGSYDFGDGLSAGYQPPGLIAPFNEDPREVNPQQIDYDFEDGGFVGYVSDFEAISGSVDLQRSDDVNKADAIAAGTFDFKFADGGELSGTFHAKKCAAIPASSGCTSADGAALLPLALAGLFLRRRSSTC